MSGIEHKFYIEQLWVRQVDGCPNAVARVNWVCVMKRNGAKVFAGGVTDLESPLPDLFINIADLEAQQVIDWVVDKLGGDVWLTDFVAGHEQAMQKAEADLGIEAWHIPLINPLKFDPANV